MKLTEPKSLCKGNGTHCCPFILSGIYADGPGAYLFHGVVEQQYIFHVMDHALCLSESKQGSCDKHVTRGGPSTTTGSPDTTPGSPTKISVSSHNKAAVAIIGFLALLQYVF